MKVKKESEKSGLKLNIQKTKIMAFGSITSWEIDGEKVETVTDFIFWVPNWERSTSRLYIVTCLFKLYAEYIMKKAGLDESQAGIKIARRNISNLRHADNTLTAESEQELKSLLMKVKEESEKAGLKLNIQKAKITISVPIISCHTDGEKVETVTDFIS